MNMFVLVAVETSSSVDKYGRRILWLLPKSKHAVESAVIARGVSRPFRSGGVILVVAHRRGVGDIGSKVVCPSRMADFGWCEVVRANCR